MSKHTEGPWQIRGDEVGYISQHDDQTFGIFCSLAIVYEDANARLIAAAPELLEVLEQVIDEWQYGYSTEDASEVYAKARQVIAKAKGEAND